MSADGVLVALFEEQRPRLRSVAYRMLGSFSDADDAVQETWLRLSRTDVDTVDNLAGWLTTVVSRVSLNTLRSRRTRREDLVGDRFPDPVVRFDDGSDPSGQAELVDSVGLALLIVLESLTPAERVAFVLHDMFAMPFDEIAPLVERTPTATRQLASRARRRVRDGAPSPDPDRARQRAVVEAFLAAAREGDLERLVRTLHPDVALHAARGAAGPLHFSGADVVAGNAVMFSRPDIVARFVVVNGAVGLFSVRQGRPFSLLTFVVVEGRIVRIDVLADPERLVEVAPAG